MLPGAALSVEPAEVLRLDAPSPAMRGLPISEAQATESVQWLADLAIDRMERVFVGEKDWGKTKRTWSGLTVRREGFEIKTKRQYKDAKHGRWIQYRLRLPTKSKQGTPGGVIATVHRVTREGDLRLNAQPGDGDTHWRIESSVETPILFMARIQRWNRGVQLMALNIQGRMRVRLDSTATLTSYADYSEVPPALVIDPRFQQARLHLVEFEVDRVSKLGGDAAEEWGNLVENVIRDVFLKRQNEKLVGTLNKSIDKNRDALRLSITEWFKGGS